MKNTISHAGKLYASRGTNQTPNPKPKAHKKQKTGKFYASDWNVSGKMVDNSERNTALGDLAKQNMVKPLTSSHRTRFQKHFSKVKSPTNPST